MCHLYFATANAATATAAVAVALDVVPYDDVDA
jgi:hypothetical protein